MKHEADNEQLLSDILAEAAPAEFREAMFRKTVRLARGRRRSRQFRQAGILLAGVLIMALIWKHNSRQPKIAQQPTQRVIEESYKVIRNEPLSPRAIITTQPFVRKEFAASENVKIIETSTGNFRAIDDEELLALVGPRALLIRTGPHSEELVFADVGGKKD